MTDVFEFTTLDKVKDALGYDNNNSDVQLREAILDANSRVGQELKSEKDFNELLKKYPILPSAARNLALSKFHLLGNRMEQYKEHLKLYEEDLKIVKTALGYFKPVAVSARPSSSF